MLKCLLIALGGGAGSLLRYLVAGWGQRLCGSGFPAGTLLVNVTGCLAIGMVGALLTGPVLIREEYRFAILVGLLGGFTTFSSFGYETLELAQSRKYAQAVANVLVSNAAGLAAVWIGYRLAQRV